MSLRDGAGAGARLPIRLYDETLEVFAGGSVERPVASLKPLLPQPERRQVLVEWNGGTVLIHPVAEQNLKVTTPLDLRVAELLLAERG